jgi:hypothetical protein
MQFTRDRIVEFGTKFGTKLPVSDCDLVFAPELVYGGDSRVGKALSGRLRRWMPLVCDERYAAACRASAINASTSRPSRAARAVSAVNVDADIGTASVTATAGLPAST